MKKLQKFLLALGVLAMAFSVAACGGDDKKDNGGGSNNGGSDSGIDLDASISKVCAKIGKCGGDKSQCMDQFDEQFDLDQVPPKCADKVDAWLKCVADSSCNDLQSAEDMDDVCPTEAHKIESCSGGAGGGGDDDDDDDDDEIGGGNGGWDDDDE